MTTPAYSIQTRQLRNGPVLEVYFRHAGKQVHRRIGPAWTKRGRAPAGYFDKPAAHDRAREIIAEHAAQQAPAKDVLTFHKLAHAYLRWLERVKGAKPSTLADHGYALAEPNGTTNGVVMRALGDRPAAEVTAAEITALLDALAESGASARTVNKRRALLGAIFNYGLRHAGLTANPVRGTDKRREPQAPPLATYSVAEVERLAAAATDPQSAEMYRVAAYTGLRQGELRALRWADVGEDVLTVSRALSSGIETGTKGGKVRHVPLIPQAREALDRLRERGDFTAPGELVYCNHLGRPLDDSALVRRFKRARDAAGLRPLRFHDLRHSYGSLLAAAGVDVVSIQHAMGHADLQMTAKYLHARSAASQVERFARAFEG